MEEEKKDVMPASSPEQTPELAPEGVNNPGEPADKTVPYSRFKEVIERKNELQEEKENLQKRIEELEKAGNPLKDEEYLTDQERELLKRQDALEKDMGEFKAEKEWTQSFKSASTTYPDLKDCEVDFREFCESRKGDVLDLAKAFLFDKKSERKGLEDPTSGPAEAPTHHYTADEVKRIRETDEKLYAKLVKEGKIDVKKMK